MVSVSEHNYWESRYQSGGTSGIGSIGKGKAWKWGIIDHYAPNIQSVVDVGCGDLSFWSGRKCEDYTGIDVSSTILERNKSSHPEWRFILSSSDKFLNGLKRECVFCFDLLFHIIDEDVFVNTLHNICRYSSHYIFVSTWKRNPFSRVGSVRRFLRTGDTNILRYLIFPAKTDMKYQYFRLLNDYSGIFREHGFCLLGEHESSNAEDCMYVFEKKQAIR